MFDNNTCNRCYKDIIWIHPQTGQTVKHPRTKRSRPLNLDGSLHLCMHKGQGEFFEGGRKTFDRGDSPSSGYWYTK